MLDFIQNYDHILVENSSSNYWKAEKKDNIENINFALFPNDNRISAAGGGLSIMVRK